MVTFSVGVNLRQNPGHDGRDGGFDVEISPIPHHCFASPCMARGDGDHDGTAFGRGDDRGSGITWRERGGEEVEGERVN